MELTLVENDHDLRLMQGQTLIWQMNYDPAEDKPYFHPLATRAGDVVTWHRPADHTWHRAHWFAWKLINEVNYWEEDESTGLSEGRTEIVEVRVDRSHEPTAVIDMQLAYRQPDGAIVLSENRRITAHPPDEQGSYRLDWDHAFTAGDRQIVLDRTLPEKHGGPGHGGYGGFSYRAAEAMMDDARLLDAHGWTCREKIFARGEPAQWMDLSGTVNHRTGAAAGVTLMDHPSNPRHPSPFFVVLNGQFGYTNPALLFDEPMTLEPGEKLHLRYRALVHEGFSDQAALQREFDAYAKTAP